MLGWVLTTEALEVLSESGIAIMRPLVFFDSSRCLQPRPRVREIPRDITLWRVDFIGLGQVENMAF
jgi:hypothetical protein